MDYLLSHAIVAIVVAIVVVLAAAVLTTGSLALYNKLTED